MPGEAATGPHRVKATCGSYAPIGERIVRIDAVMFQTTRVVWPANAPREHLVRNLAHRLGKTARRLGPDEWLCSVELGKRQQYIWVYVVVGRIGLQVPEDLGVPTVVYGGP